MVIKRRRNGLLVCYGPIAISVVLPCCVFQYRRQYEAFDAADDTSRLLAGSCKFHQFVARR